MNRQGTQGFQSSENTLYDNTVMDIYHHTTVWIHRMYNTKVNPKVYYGDSLGSYEMSMEVHP